MPWLPSSPYGDPLWDFPSRLCLSHLPNVPALHPSPRLLLSSTAKGYSASNIITVIHSTESCAGEGGGFQTKPWDGCLDTEQ